MVQGQINGTIVGELRGFVRGEANLIVNMGKVEKVTEEEAQRNMPPNLAIPEFNQEGGGEHESEN